LAWFSTFAAFAAWRIWLNSAYSEPLLSPGALLMAPLLGCMAWLMADPPRLDQRWAWRLGLAFLAMLLLFSGEQLLWLRSADKDNYLAAGYGLLLGGAGLLALPYVQGKAEAGETLPARTEWVLLSLMLLGGALARIYKLGEVPATWWYDEVNLARAAQDHILIGRELPVYVAENVENPGMYLWIVALVFKCFGVGITPLRELSALFGWLALIPFYFLARRLLGVAYGLVALALFCAMRWTLIPQHIGFMSGFALFWTFCAVYFYWTALGSRRRLDFLLAGLCLGFTLHTYTPTRLVIPMLALFSLLQWRLLRGIRLWDWLALAGGFVLVALPMLWYILGNWGAYSQRAGQVSILNDVRVRGWGELAISFFKHLECFNFRGDFNARHNIHFWPQLDFISGALFAPALILAHARAFKDPRALLLCLWFWAMLGAGIFSMTVEAPQAHRTILVAPMAALCLAWFLAEMGRSLAPAFPGGWPRPLTLALILTCAAVPCFNAYELYANWPQDSATWRSFSPEATLAARRAQACPKGWEIYLSPLSQEYQFHGFERDQFLRFVLKQQGRSFYELRPSQGVSSNPSSPLGGVLAIWGDSDSDISAAMQRDFPDIPVEQAKDPFETRNDYLAAQIPFDRIPQRKRGDGPQPLFFKL
jgi:4-amino-4-deoxy-L-arabinose transferase-like glycosyltransferase